jgi:hypothetical protein
MALSNVSSKKVRAVTLALGGLWLVDGILQLQPGMFTSTFVNQVLALNLVGEPHWVAAIVSLGIRVWNMDMALHNALAALIQLLIGALLVLPLGDAARRWGLWISVAWGLVIWIFGEGFGMLASGSATFYSGAPGSALIYVIIALFLLYYSDRIDALPRIAGIMMVACAALNFTPMFFEPTMLSMFAMGAPASFTGWLSSIGAQGTGIGNVFAIDALILVGIFPIVAPKNRAAAWTAIAFLALVWWIGQGFGGIETFPFGVATDPNSAPVLALFLLPAIIM